MDIRLIAMDLDGTALQRDRCSFSPRLNAALDAAHEKGIHIVPITGRQYGMLPPAVQGHPKWENLVVLCNGGQIRRLATGEALYEKNISSEALQQLLGLSQELDIPLEFSTDSVLHLTQRSYDQQLPIEALRFHRDTILRHHGKIVPSLASLCGKGAEKAQLPHIPTHLKARVEEAMNAIPVSAVWASANSMEITHPDAKKGIVLKEICRILNISMENVLALGDSGNDETMLRQAGLGVAMGNAPDFVKAAAKAVTETNENDGAAIAIERYVL